VSRRRQVSAAWLTGADKLIHLQRGITASLTRSDCQSNSECPPRRRESNSAGGPEISKSNFEVVARFKSNLKVDVHSILLLLEVA